MQSKITPIMHRRSYIDVISAKIYSIMPAVFDYRRGDQLNAALPITSFAPASLLPESAPAKEGFTLAEVLITLGIIGVVAAITIPQLMSAYKAHKLRSQFLKSYSTIQQVFKQMEADDVSTDPSTYKRTDNKIFYQIFKDYLSSATDCSSWYTKKESNSICYFPDSKFKYKTFNKKNNIKMEYFDDGQLVLQDGTLLLFEQPSTSNPYIWVFVDLNGGSTPPNILGYDLFTFQFLDRELRTMGDKQTKYNDLSLYCNLESSNPLNGIACAHRAKSETDYFKWVVKNIK